MGLSDVYTAWLDFAPRDNLNLSLMFNLVDENDWLNWLNDNFFGIYKKNKTTVASINWFGGDKHELRLKAQMVGFTARDPQSYQSDFDGNLISTDLSLDPFTLSDLAFQVRYRYEILPLAYLYVVYSRGEGSLNLMKKIIFRRFIKDLGIILKQILLPLKLDIDFKLLCN